MDFLHRQNAIFCIQYVSNLYKLRLVILLVFEIYYIMHLPENFPIQSVFDYYFANKLLLLSLLSLCLLRQGITLRSLPTCIHFPRPAKLQS